MTTSLPAIADLPVRIGIRRLALTYLEHAESARKRMTLSRDEEGLHDFRVALRRLRSCLSAYRPFFSDTVRGWHRRAVRELAASTGAARDVEVQLAWLEAERDLTEDAAVGVCALIERLARVKRPLEHSALVAVHRFPALRAQLEPALLRYCEKLDRANPARAVSCAEAAADLAGPVLDQLESALAAVGPAGDGAAIHAARITGKRVRYLFEPYRDTASGGPAMIKRLRRFQDLLGDLHDLDVLLEVTRAEARTHDPDDGTASAGLMALAVHIEAEREAASRRIVKSWAGARGHRLVSVARAFAASLRPLPDALENIEIERKYLLRSLPRLPADAVVVRIEQGYLPGRKLVERVRRVRGPSETRYYRTVKLGSGIRRIEVEEETDEVTFKALWRLTKGRRVSKRRYVVMVGDRKWEIDRFLGRKLVLAEVELPHESAAAVPPEWLRRRIVREVTGEPQYLNVNLAG